MTLRIALTGAVLAAGIAGVIVTRDEADAGSCKALGQETSGLVRSGDRPGQLVKSIATSGPGAASNLIREEMAILCE